MRGVKVVSEWEPDPGAGFKRRIGRSMKQIDGGSLGTNNCPDIWELDNGDILVIGRDMTAAYSDRLPPDVFVRPDERLVVIPRALLSSAEPEIPDA